MTRMLDVCVAHIHLPQSAICPALPSHPSCAGVVLQEFLSLQGDCPHPKVLVRSYALLNQVEIAKGAQTGYFAIENEESEGSFTKVEGRENEREREGERDQEGERERGWDKGRRRYYLLPVILIIYT